MSTLIHQRVAAAQAGTNPAVICRMPSGWAVLGDAQFLRGYSLLLADPVVPNLNALGKAQRQQFLYDMSVIGDALLEVAAAFLVNYEILGNTDPALHAHLFPRYSDEPETYRKGPVWIYDREFRLSRPFDAVRDRSLIEQLAAAIQRRLE